ncbi:MAG: flagellar biosynthetic protein FliR [Oscillospiraceae bacterium]|nr:flagellar biosynthetic protein FliR [Oscillospiraceae bacterium]
MLIMLRMTGFLVLNPILGRRNIPSMVNAVLAFLLAFLLLDTVADPPIADPTFFQFALLAVRELFIGFAGGVLFQMFVSILIVGGEIIDLQQGISMAKAFDPTTNATVSISSNFFIIMYTLIFFTTGNHLTFIHLMSVTLRVLPVGDFALNLDGFFYMPELFSTILVFAMKLALPVVVIETIVSMAVGIIMRIIPQINVFVVNIQFKLFTGLLILVLLVGPVIGYFGNMIEISFEMLGDSLGAMFSR